MTTLSQRLQNPGYKAWIKTVLCLCFVKEGLEDFADDCSKQFHKAVLNKLKNSGNPSINGICRNATIKRGRASCCLNCQAFVDEIDQQNQKSFKFAKHNWDNSDVSLWPTDPWEMAKVFMNQGQKATQRSPIDTDLSGILNFIDHCVAAKRCIVNAYNIQKVRDARNNVMHSASMTLSQTESSDIIGDIVDLLEDPGALSGSLSAQVALASIHKVKVSNFDISTEDEMKVVSEKIDVLQQKINILESSVKEHSESLKELQSIGDSNVAQLQEKIKLLQETKQELLSEVQSLKERIDTYGDIKEEIQDQLRDLNKTPVETDSDKAARHFQEALIQEYKRIGFDVPLSPIYDGLNDDLQKIDIDAVSTNLVIEVQDKNEEIPLTSYKDIFRMEGRQNRTIFLKGEAGVGKSTWCMRLLYGWTKTHDKDSEKTVDHKVCNSDDSNHKIQELEKAISQFDYLFLVPLRYVKGQSSIKDVIFSPLLERLSSMRDTVDTLIQRCSDKVLILLDGIDEYAHDLNYEGLNQCTVVTTTRPWKYDHVCASNPGLKIDITLKLKGLDDLGIKNLTEKLYKALRKNNPSNMPNSQSKIPDDPIASFSHHVSNCGLTDALKVPLTLIILLETFLDHGSLSPSMTVNLVNLIEVLIHRGEQKMLESESSVLRKCKESRSKENIIALFAANDTLSEYSSLLQKVSQLAFEGIFNSRKEESLVFNQKQLDHIFYEDELRLCLKFGLLSRSRFFTSMLSKTKIMVSFYHKLVQEFFAAACIISNMKALTVFKNRIKSPKDIVEIENVFVFICGMDAHLGSELSKHCVEVCKNVAIPHAGDEWDKYMWRKKAATTVKVMIKGQKEIDSRAQQPETLCVLDMVISHVEFCVNEDIILKVLGASTWCLRSVCLNPSVYYCLKAEKKFCCRKSRILELLSAIRYLPNFEHLELAGGCDKINWNILLEVVPCLQTLKNLTLCDFIISGGDLIVNCKELRILVFENTSIGESSLILNSYKLENVIIQDLAMAADGWSRLFKLFSKQENLTTLTLKGVDMSGESLNLSNSRHLRTLDVTSVELASLIVSEGTDLRELVLINVKMSELAWHRLISTLTFKSLNVLQLSQLDVGSAEIDLSHATLLYEVPIDNVKFCVGDSAGQRQAGKTNLESTNSSGWERFFNTLPKTTLNELRLSNIDIGHAEIDLSQATQLNRVSIDNVSFCVRDCEGQKQAGKTNLELTNSSHWERFFNSLPTETLWRLELRNVDIVTAMITIDRRSSLMWMILVNVKMTKLAFDKLLSSLKSLSELSWANIRNVEVEDKIINMTTKELRS